MVDGKPLRIGVAGLGTVGGGVLKLISANAALLARRTGRPLQVVAVSARDRSRDRGVDLSAVRWYENAADLALPSRARPRSIAWSSWSAARTARPRPRSRRLSQPASRS